MDFELTYLDIKIPQGYCKAEIFNLNFVTEQKDYRYQFLKYQINVNQEKISTFNLSITMYHDLYLQKNYQVLFYNIHFSFNHAYFYLLIHCELILLRNYECRFII